MTTYLKIFNCIFLDNLVVCIIIYIYIHFYNTYFSYDFFQFLQNVLFCAFLVPVHVVMTCLN